MFFYLCLFTHELNEKNQLQNILQIKKTQTNEDSDEGEDDKHQDQGDEGEDDKHQDQGDEAVLRNSNTVSTNLYILNHKFVYIGSQICIHWITNLYLLPGVQD